MGMDIIGEVREKLGKIAFYGYDSAEQAEELRELLGVLICEIKPAPCTGLDNTPYHEFFQIAERFMTKNLPPYPGQGYRNKIQAEKLEMLADAVLDDDEEPWTKKQDYEFLGKLLDLCGQALERQQALCEARRKRKGAAE